MPPQTTISPRAWGDIVALSLIWGTSFLAIRIALDEIGPVTAVAHRVVWAALALWVWVLVRRVPLPRDRGTWAAFAVMGCLNNVVPFTLMAWGQTHIETGLTAILNATTAVFALPAAALFFRDERLTRRRVLGVALGFAGVVTTIGPATLVSFDVRSAAQLAVLAGTVSYALAASWGRARLSGLSPEVAALGMLTAAALIMLPVAYLVEGPLSLALPARILGAIGFYALFATAGAYLLYYRILRAAGAANAMLVTLMIPPVAIVLGALVRHEALAPRVFLGFGLIALGLWGMNRRRTPALPPAGEAR